MKTYVGLNISKISSFRIFGCSSFQIRLAAVVLILGFVVPGFTAAANTHYIAINGNDSSGAGFSASPWSNINHALSKVISGDTIKIKPGKYEIKFNARRLPSGIYFYKFSAGDYSELKKMVLMK